MGVGGAVIGARWRVVAGLLAGLASSMGVAAPEVPAAVASRLAAGQPAGLIVEYDVDAEDRALEALRTRRGVQRDDDVIGQARRARYKAVKDAVEIAAGGSEVATDRDYSHLPMSAKRFTSRAALNHFLADARIKAVYEDIELHPVLAQSLPLIEQPAAAAVGYQGAGTTVAVIDDGIDYTRTDFGSCTAPGAPASCRVVVAQDFGSGSTDKSHGTNVSATVLGVAPGSRIAMLNVFSGTTASSSAILSAINWAIANASTYNIAAMNLSLGDGKKYTSACATNNAFLTPFNRARAVGITVVTAAGNDMYTDGISWPACSPNAISVGAVYDANVGGVSWGSSLCTDSTTAANKVACFSDSASFMTIMAPGAMVTAGGSTKGGTSQAAPHVAGAVAVLRAAFPAETLAQTQTRLTNSGVTVTDTRNGLIFPRLDLANSARPANDAFSSRITVASSGGSATGTNLLASVETGEPAHAGLVDTHTVWYTWTAPASGQFIFKTAGSSVNTVVAAYTGSSLSTLNPVASDATAGGASVVFQAQSGTSYALAVDGASGASGSLNLVWTFNSAPKANLAVALNTPTSVVVGYEAPVQVTVSNVGPQTATGVKAVITLPEGTAFVSGDTGCTANGQIVTCVMGSITSGGSATATLMVAWNTLDTETVSVSVGSEVSDPVATDNAVASQTVVQLDAADVPVMPPAAVALLGVVLLGAIRRARR